MEIICFRLILIAIFNTSHWLHLKTTVNQPDQQMVVIRQVSLSLSELGMTTSESDNIRLRLTQKLHTTRVDLSKKSIKVHIIALSLSNWLFGHILSASNSKLKIWK